MKVKNKKSNKDERERKQEINSLKKRWERNNEDDIEIEQENDGFIIEKLSNNEKMTTA